MPDPAAPLSLRALLEDVRAGRLDVDEGVRRLAAAAPTAELGFASLDLDREARCGAPEVVFGQGKEPEQLVAIARALVERHGRLLVTRVAPEGAAALTQALPGAEHHASARAITVGGPASEGRGLVLVVSAGTSDGPVAAEAALTARWLGARVDELRDVGVAGLHRLLAHTERLRAARALVVVAGMEGALASVVGGLVARPVVAVPTSIGYGSAFGGIAALLTMMNSCAAGVTVVNIDNGFGAGYAAARINELSLSPAP